MAGLEAAEEVFLTLDSQQQLEAFVSDGEAVEAGKVIARMVGFADVLISAERVALNLLQRLSGIATLTDKYVKAVEGTGTFRSQIRARLRLDCVCSNDTQSNSVADTTAGLVWTTAWW